MYDCDPPAVVRAKRFLLGLTYLGATLFYLGATIALIYFLKFLGLIIVISAFVAIVAIIVLILIFSDWETNGVRNRLVIAKDRDLEQVEQSWVLQDETDIAHDDKPEPSELN